MICFYCNRKILNGTKILQNGVHYICKDETDIIICNTIRNEATQQTTEINFDTRQNKIKDNGGTHINCACGKSFYTHFFMETDPPCDRCPYCERLHRDKR